MQTISTTICLQHSRRGKKLVRPTISYHHFIFVNTKHYTCERNLGLKCAGEKVDFILNLILIITNA